MTLAVVPVRQGRPPAGADETVAEAQGRGLLVGDLAAGGVAGLTSARHLQILETASFAPAALAATLAPLVAHEALVLLPASADGRDLAPRLAHALGWPLLAGAVLAEVGRVVVARLGGRRGEEHRPDGPVVVTLVPGSRGVEPRATGAPPPEVVTLEPASAPAAPDAELLAVSPPAPDTIDLAEAERIAAAGAGLGDQGAMAHLARVAQALGASVGATRMVTDAGWLPADRQIGTTGSAVSPRLYLAFGVSGAVQHVAGLGLPDHVVAVNTDASCPMMAMADLAIVADAPALLAELAALLEQPDG